MASRRSIIDNISAKFREWAMSLPTNLQADAYAGYDHIFFGSNNSVIEVACWSKVTQENT